MKIALAGVLGAFALQLSHVHANLGVGRAGKFLRSKAMPVHADEDPAYFIRSYYVGNDCVQDELYSVDVVTLDKCVETDTAGQWVKVTCDGTVVNSAFYSDAGCTAEVADSASTWDAEGETPLGTCTNRGSASIKPVCSSVIDEDVLALSHVEGYMGDETCADEDSLLIEQFFVMNKCISNGDLSQQQFCDESHAVFYYYNGADCNPEDELSMASYPVDECIDPQATDATTADLALLPKSSHRIMHCTSTDGIPDDDAVVPLYFTRYLFVGDTCDEENFISAEVLMSGKCIQTTDTTYMMLECDETGAHSALYSDAICSQKIAGSEDTWDKAQLGACTTDTSDGVYSVLPTCGVTLKDGVKYLSSADAYYNDEECSDLTQLVSRQYFVTDKCFDTGNGFSRAMYCDERGVAFYSFQGSGCDFDAINSLSFYDLDDCNDPQASMPDDKATISLMSASSYRGLTCNSTGILPDSPSYFTRNLYVGAGCAPDNFISAEVLLANKCMEYGEGTYMMLKCDETGAHSALYSDKFCTTKIEGSDDSWDNAPMDTCTASDGYAVYPTCQTKIDTKVKQLSSADAYYGDDSCSDNGQLLSQQFFVTDQCFKTGPSASRAMYCDERGVAFYSYKTDNCDPDEVNSLMVYKADSCNDPQASMPDDKAPISLMSASSYRSLTCNSNGTLPDSPLYFTRYMYAGDSCADDQFISAEVLLADKCMEYGEGTYMKLKCDGTGPHSALYSDKFCTEKIEGSDDKWTNAPMNKCTASDGYSVYPTCESEIKDELKELSVIEGYTGDSECSDTQQLVSKQYFVTDQCFKTGDGFSRAMYCDERGVGFYSYKTEDCDPEKVTSVSLQQLDTCYKPQTKAPEDKATISLLSASSYRELFCNSDGGLPDDDIKGDDDDGDDDDFGGLTVGGLVGVIVGCVVVVVFGLGLFFHFNKKPGSVDDGKESLLGNQH